MSANALAPFKRLTIKIGSALLVDKTGRLRAAWLADLAADIAARLGSSVRPGVPFPGILPPAGPRPLG